VRELVASHRPLRKLGISKANGQRAIAAIKRSSAVGYGRVAPKKARLNPRSMKTLNLREAAAFLHMHPEEVRTQAKRGLIPGAKIGRRWIFIEIDLAEFVRSLYPVRWQALPGRTSAFESADRSSGSTSTLRTMREYDDLLKLAPGRRRKRFQAC